ncbi:hypothetical protein GCM10009678_49600 [Actinomadura kijaniata]|uniref:Uncharacterized protein n=1 Tax=Actinomadura namibiensis TaxID=182080 RepID=A0A7W3LNX7_ACTNM|nr:hypothetical protein [Actinomadura namibiensis]MBA8951562.1 hypothetical protein [Actinomadura namibiensis]
MDRNDPGQDADLRRLSGAARVADRDLAADPELRALLDDLRDGVMAAARPRRRPAFRLPTPRRLVPALAAVLTMTLILGGGLALRQPRTDHGTPATSSTAPSTAPPNGERHSFNTGLYGAPHAGKLGPGEAADASEWLFLGDPGMPAHLDGIQRPLSLPPGVTWEPIRRQLTLPGKRMQRTFVRINVVRYALCEWGAVWNGARRKNDTRAASHAQRAILRIAPRVFEGPDPRSDRDGDVILYGLMGKPYGPYEIRMFLTMNCVESWHLAGAVR